MIDIVKSLCISCRHERVWALSCCGRDVVRLRSSMVSSDLGGTWLRLAVDALNFPAYYFTAATPLKSSYPPRTPPSLSTRDFYLHSSPTCHSVRRSFFSLERRNRPATSKVSPKSQSEASTARAISQPQPLPREAIPLFSISFPCLRDFLDSPVSVGFQSLPRSQRALQRPSPCSRW
jgi:hypothetical protein